MKKMNWKIGCLIILFVASLSGISMAQKVIQTDPGKMQHPRILLLSGEENIIKQSVAANPTWKKMHEAILQSCDVILEKPPVERIQIGRRLLDKSREALRRIFQLSYAWRMTGDEKYFNRAEKELLAISKFSDWNPSHFLDVAEMTMAVSIGYDWLFPKLSAESKKVIRDAIVTKGIYPSLDPKYNSWLDATNNWNQVCNAGITYGALAVYEDHPDLAQNMIERAISSIPHSMGEYKPDGAYPEGYGYWGYGTSFNVMFLSALEKIYKSDFGLNSTPGFLKTAGFFQHMTGATGLCYNWGDSGLGGSLSPAMFWLAQKNNDPSLLWVEKSYLKTDKFSKFTDDRLLPAVMIWGKDLPLDKVVEPKATFWKGQGANPVCLMRTSWSDRNAIFLGFKAGSASVNHGHMDIGSFVMEADGTRWASDFGMQDYESLESKGIQVFGRTQDAQRWSIFRINNRAHNTLTVDNQLQMVKGYAKIVKFSDQPDFMFAQSNLSTVYQGQLASEKRGVAIVDKKFVVVRDEMAAKNKATTVRWTMMTSADVKLGAHSILLSKEGHTLSVRINATSKIKMKTWSTEPTTTYDAPNPGKTLVGFEMQLKPNQKAGIEVLLVPGSVKEKKIIFDKKLGEW
ncbi:MAG: heparinase II/III family protein [Bacteroidetes bacterium]|nr:heparinase II/III family protein [Bacteroidota bacterium]MCL6101656.1 heparinase II/III family protein [Bacteroidota bacterium]